VFFRWWLGELAELIPKRLRPSARRRQNRLVLEVSGDALQVLQCQGQASHALLRIPLTADGWGDQQGLVDGLGLPPQALEGTILRLPTTQALTRLVHLPRAVQENLPQVLKFEMDRLTPFRGEDVYFDFRLLDESDDRGRIGIELTLVPRAYLDPLLTSVERLGFRPTVVDVATTDMPDQAPCAGSSINLLPQGQGRRNETPGLRRNLALAGLTGVLLLTALVLPLWQMRSVLQSLETEVQAAREEALKTTALSDELERGVQQVRFLLDKKTTAPSVVDVLDEMTRTLPDGTWLTSFRMEGETVTVQGESAAATDLIALIEDSSRFEKTRFLASVTHSQITKTDRFQIGTEAPGGGGSE